MTEIRVGSVDVLLLDPRDELRVLILQRTADTRCPGSWEIVHGMIEPGELPEDAALREVHEETGLAVDRLYNVTTQAFYLHRHGHVNLAIGFAALTDSRLPLHLGAEHAAGRWVTEAEALESLSWPRARQLVTEALRLLSGGNAGNLEDVLRVR